MLLKYFMIRIMYFEYAFKILESWNYSQVPIKRVSIINEDPGFFSIILKEYNLINEYTGKKSISVNEYVVINEYRGGT